MPAILYPEDWPADCVFMGVFGNSCGWEMLGAGAVKAPAVGMVAFSIISSSSMISQTSEPMSPMTDGGPLDLFDGPVNWFVMICPSS